MANAQHRLLGEVRRAQAKVERADANLQTQREERRTSFKRAQTSGLSLRQIAEASGLHWTRVREIINGK